MFSMRTQGRVMPALLAVGLGGPIYFVPSSLRDELAKASFANLARLLCVAHAATAAVLMAEAWMKVASLDGTLDLLDLTLPPSESLHRKEVVILTGESRTGCRQKLLPIIRTGAGGFFGFGEFAGPEATSFSERFAPILPPEPPKSAEQARARAWLEAMGVMAEAWGAINPDFAERWPQKGTRIANPERRVEQQQSAGAATRR